MTTDRERPILKYRPCKHPDDDAKYSARIRRRIELMRAKRVKPSAPDPNPLAPDLRKA